jgi:hypothetical protein
MVSGIPGRKARRAVPSPTDRYTSKIRRPHGVHTRFADDEIALLSAAANGQNLALGEFVRRTVLDSLAKNETQEEPSPTVVLEEIQALKLTFASTILPLLSGKRLSEEQSAVLLRNCDAAKEDAAKKVFRTFRERKEKP